MKRFDWTNFFRKPYRIYIQLVFWIIVFSLFIILKEYPPRMSGLTMICNVFQVTLELALPSYSQNLLILPLLKRGKWLQGAILYGVQVILFIWLLPYVLNAVGWLFGFFFHLTDLVDWRNEHIAFSIIAFTVIAGCVKIAVDQLITDKEQKEDELRHLKAQLNPHFLFNTLNNLYGLSIAESKELPDLMLKLSDLLRYSLYDTGQRYVPLQKEVDYISNYIELERLRLNNRTEINFDIQGDFTEHYIAPLLLIVFVENSFKHFSAAKDEASFVHISISLDSGKLRLRLKNSVDPSIQVLKIPRRQGGLGLMNAKQRLDLIYPGQYQLSSQRQAQSFETDLQMNLQ